MPFKAIFCLIETHKAHGLLIATRTVMVKSFIENMPEKPLKLTDPKTGIWPLA